MSVTPRWGLQGVPEGLHPSRIATAFWARLIGRPLNILLTRAPLGGRTDRLARGRREGRLETGVDLMPIRAKAAEDLVAHRHPEHRASDLGDHLGRQLRVRLNKGREG